MTKKTRRIIFYIFLVLFAFLAGAIILYAQGYKLDWQNKSLSSTGAFYLKSQPKGASIYINEKLRGATNKFIRRLLPDKYDIEISKAGYHTWQKTLKTTSKMVTEAKNILLIKKDIKLNTLAVPNDVQKIFISPNKKRLIYLTNSIPKIDPEFQKVADPREISYSGPSLQLLEISKDEQQIYPISVSKDAGFVSRLPSLETIKEIVWSENGYNFILLFSNGYYYNLNLENEPKLTNLTDLIRNLSDYQIYTFDNLQLHPNNTNKIYFRSKNNLYYIKIDYSQPLQSVISGPIIYDILNYTILNNKILYVKDLEGGLYETNLDVSSFKKLFDVPFIYPNCKIKILSPQIIIVDNTLYFFNDQIQSLEKITDNIKGFQFTEDNKKFLWNTDKEIGVIWLEPELEQPQKNKFDREIIIKTLENINQALWYPGTTQHIIFIIENNIKITELDSRDKRNTFTIISAEKPNVFFSEIKNKLFILSQKNLFDIEI